MEKFSFLDTTLLVNGVPLSGFAEGDTTIELRRLNDSASHVVGNDGTMVVSLSADRSGEVVFRLMQTSSSNLALSGLVSIQEAGVFTPVYVLFRDVYGGDLGIGSNGYIPKPADMSRGEKANPQEWRIVVESLRMLHNGN